MTNTATRNATHATASDPAFKIDFSKKALSALTLRNMEAHKRLNIWLSDPLMQHTFAPLARERLVEALEAFSFVRQSDNLLVKNRRMALMSAVEAQTKAPVPMGQSAVLKLHEWCVQYPQSPEASHHYRKQDNFSRLNRLAGIGFPMSQTLPSVTQALFAWLDTDAVKRLPLEHQGLLALYYGLSVHPFEVHNASVWFAHFYGCLRKAGFGLLASEIICFYAQDIERTAVVLATQNQQAWFDYFLHAWQHSIETAECAINRHLKRALFMSQLQQHVDAHDLSERAQAVVVQLLANREIDTKKALYGSPWYKTLYKKVTTRTQERDLKALCDLGFITWYDKQRFVLNA